MRFKRISTDTVRCIITQEELQENGLNLDDFLANDGKTEEFLRKMISLAEEEVGFKVQGGPMTIQVAVLPENTLALTFSEKQPGNIMDLLEGLRAAMSSLTGAVEQKTQERMQEAEPALVEKRKAYVLEFTQMKDFESFCASVPLDIEEELGINTKLYRYEGNYCLILERGELDEKQLCRIMSTSTEFMAAASAKASQVAYIIEHGTEILTDHAIRQMQSLLQH
ncbi:MAG: adaptor protein MecA [bacterium]|nr:adaptor protein MecA [bacterium]